MFCFSKFTTIFEMFESILVFSFILYYKLIFRIWYSDSVSFSVYMKLIKCIFSKNVPEVWTIFVRNIFGIWGPKWSAYVAEASLGRSYKGIIDNVSKMLLLWTYQHHDLRNSMRGPLHKLMIIYIYIYIHMCIYIDIYIYIYK